MASRIPWWRKHVLVVARWIDRNRVTSAVGVACVPLLGGWVLLELTVGPANALPGELHQAARRGAMPPPSQLPEHVRREQDERRAQLQALFDGLETKTRDEKLRDATDAFFKFNQAEGASDWQRRSAR